MRNEEILQKVRVLLQGNNNVEVYIWNRPTGKTERVEAGSLQNRLDQLSESEEVLGAIYYSGYEEPGCEEFTTGPKGLAELQGIFGSVIERQAALRETTANTLVQKKAQ